MPHQQQHDPACSQSWHAARHAQIQTHADRWCAESSFCVYIPDVRKVALYVQKAVWPAFVHLAALHLVALLKLRSGQLILLRVEGQLEHSPAARMYQLRAYLSHCPAAKLGQLQAARLPVHSGVPATSTRAGWHGNLRGRGRAGAAKKDDDDASRQGMIQNVAYAIMAALKGPAALLQVRPTRRSHECTTRPCIVLLPASSWASNACVRTWCNT